VLVKKAEFPLQWLVGERALKAKGLKLRSREWSFVLVLIMRLKLPGRHEGFGLELRVSLQLFACLALHEKESKNCFHTFNMQ
jgi:hypothetical protein